MSGNSPVGPPPGPTSDRAPSPAIRVSSRRRWLTHIAFALGGLLVGILIGVSGSGGGKNSPSATVTVTTTATRVGTGRQPAAATPSATTAPHHESKPKGEIPGDGTFLVGNDMKAGTYRTEGKNQYGCYWARLSDTTGELNAIIANGNVQGPAIVKVAASDKAFQTTDCKPWKKIG